MTKNYVTREEFEKLGERVANLEGILREKETRKKLKSRYYRIRLLNPGDERVGTIISESEGPVTYTGDGLIVNGLVIRGLDREGIPYEEIK